MTFIHLDPSDATQSPTRGLWARLRRALTGVEASDRNDPVGWNPCGCINALRDTCDPPSQRDAQYRAALRHAVTKP